MTFIQPDDLWSLWTIMIVIAAGSIFLEQKFSWANKVTGAVLALVGAIILANLNIIPTASPAYDTIWDFVVPVAVTMLLFRADIRKIWRESGRMFSLFWFAAIGTCVGVFVATMLLADKIPELGKIAGIISASYIGGGVNFTAMTAVYKPDESLVNAVIVADNFVMAGFFMLYLAIPTFKWISKHFKVKYAESVVDSEISKTSETKAASYWGAKEISLLDIALGIMTAFVIAAISKKIGIQVKAIMPEGNAVFDMLRIILGNQFFLITLITTTLVAGFPKYFERLNGTQEMGTFMIYLFFVVLGVPASIKDILLNSPMLFVYCVIVCCFNLAVVMIAGKVFKYSIEEQMLAANATIGGPTTAAGMAISKGWTDLVVPALLCGLAGYITGNYFGLFMGNWLISILG